MATIFISGGGRYTNAERTCCPIGTFRSPDRTELAKLALDYISFSISSGHKGSAQVPTEDEMRNIQGAKSRADAARRGKLDDIIKEYLDILEKREWSVSGYTDDGRVELEWWSPAGEDFLVCVNVENFPDEILDYSDDFDPDEHIEMWVEARANGRQDVPGARRLAKDAEDIQKELDELAFELQEAERKLWLTGITAPSAR